MITTKLESDYHLTLRLIKREVRKLTSTVTVRNANFVNNYSFSAGGGSSFGGTGGTTVDRTTAVVYDPAQPGVSYEQTRTKIQGKGSAILLDNNADDAIDIVVDNVNDPLYWLR